jgi:hypothetical protein
VRQTVSPSLAAFMSAQYGVPFTSVPNCEPADRLLPLKERRARRDGQCVFLFQGNFAPGRGIDLLIQAWAETDPRAILQLRGPDNPFKAQMVQLAKDTGLLGTRILFPTAVDESRLIAAAAEADVGVIPYAPTGTNYRHCCPNKMSQYMAAGLPILANATDFVAPTVRAAGCGVVCDFSRRANIVRAVALLCTSAEQRSAFGRAGRDYFRDTFNWNAASRGMYEQLLEAIGARPPEPLSLYGREAVAGEAKLRVVRTPMESLVQFAEALVGVGSPPPPVVAPAPEPAAVPEPVAIVAPVVVTPPEFYVPPPPPPAAAPRRPPFAYRAVRYLWRRSPDALRRACMPIAARINLLLHV